MKTETYFDVLNLPVWPNVRINSENYLWKKVKFFLLSQFPFSVTCALGRCYLHLILFLLMCVSVVSNHNNRTQYPEQKDSKYQRMMQKDSIKTITLLLTVCSQTEFRLFVRLDSFFVKSKSCRWHDRRVFLGGQQETTTTKKPTNLFLFNLKMTRRGCHAIPTSC